MSRSRSVHPHSRLWRIVYIEHVPNTVIAAEYRIQRLCHRWGLRTQRAEKEGNDQKEEEG